MNTHGEGQCMSDQTETPTPIQCPVCGSTEHTAGYHENVPSPTEDPET